MWRSGLGYGQRNRLVLVPLETFRSVIRKSCIDLGDRQLWMTFRRPRHVEMVLRKICFRDRFHTEDYGACFRLFYYGQSV